jgi:hypothetical protein
VCRRDRFSDWAARDFRAPPFKIPSRCGPIITSGAIGPPFLLAASSPAPTPRLDCRPRPAPRNYTAERTFKDASNRGGRDEGHPAMADRGADPDHYLAVCLRRALRRRQRLMVSRHCGAPIVPSPSRAMPSHYKAGTERRRKASDKKDEPTQPSYCVWGFQDERCQDKEREGRSPHPGQCASVHRGLPLQGGPRPSLVLGWVGRSDRRHCCVPNLSLGQDTGDPLPAVHG